MAVHRAKRYGEWLVRWRYPVLAICLLLVAVAGSGGQFLAFKTDYRVFFSKDNPQLQAFEQLQNTYTKTDNVLFVLAPKDGRVFSNDTLASAIALTEAAWQIPYSIRVDSITNFQHTEADGDDLTVDDLVPEAGELDAAALRRIRDIALAEPLLRNRLISANGQVTGVNVTVQLPDPDVQTGQEVPEVAAYARQLVETLGAANPNLDIYLTGMVMMNNSFPEVSIRDQQTLVPTMFVVVILTLALLLRSFTATLGTVFVIVFSVITAMGLAGWAGMKLTPPSATSPTIILTLAVADCVHILVTFLARHAPGDGQDQRRGRESQDQPATRLPDIGDNRDWLHEPELQRCTAVSGPWQHRRRGCDAGLRLFGYLAAGTDAGDAGAHQAGRDTPFTLHGPLCRYRGRAPQVPVLGHRFYHRFPGHVHSAQRAE
jgi:predicted RND superfamily exporter protein